MGTRINHHVRLMQIDDPKPELYSRNSKHFRSTLVEPKTPRSSQRYLLHSWILQIKMVWTYSRNIWRPGSWYVSGIFPENFPFGLVPVPGRYIKPRINPACRFHRRPSSIVSRRGRGRIWAGCTPDRRPQLKEFTRRTLQGMGMWYINLRRFWRLYGKWQTDCPVSRRWYYLKCEGVSKVKITKSTKMKKIIVV